MLDTTPMYSLKDVAIIPATYSNINSRSECNPYYAHNKLPIFTAPMSAVVNTDNLLYWENNKIIPILPRTIDYNARIKFAEITHNWIALSLNEFKYIRTIFKDNCTFNLLIDVANGHMKQIYDLCVDTKTYAMGNFENCQVNIMIGNVANPSTITYIATKVNTPKVKYIDYVRCGIGSGSCCTSSSQTSIHYGMASLLNEINKIKSVRQLYTSMPYIIADGGIKTYNDAITALALGADYVMIGTTFASLFESAAPFNQTIDEVILAGTEDKKQRVMSKYSLTKEVYGMSTYKAQKDIDKTAPKRLTEGIGRIVECHNTIEGWTDAFVGYLKSCMSYCGCSTLKDFIGKPECRVMSPMLNNSINSNIDNHVNEYLHIVK